MLKKMPTAKMICISHRWICTQIFMYPLYTDLYVPFETGGDYLALNDNCKYMVIRVAFKKMPICGNIFWNNDTW
jgi:hypothetical protein